MELKSSSSQPEWEKRMSSLGQQERDLHQSQLRLIRDQTFSFTRDLAALKTELFNQKVTLQSLQNSNTSDNSLSDMNQKKHKQLMDHQLGELLQQTKLMATTEKLYTVQEQMEHSFREALQKAQQNLEERLSKRLERLELQLSDLYDGPVAKLRPLMHADVLGSLRSSQEKCSELLRQMEAHRSEQKEGQRAAELRCSGLQDSLDQLHESRRHVERNLSELHANHNEAMKSHEELRNAQKQLKDGHQASERRLQELGAHHGAAVKSHEDLHKTVNELKDTQSAHERRVQELHSSHSRHQDLHKQLEQKVHELHEKHGEAAKTHEELAQSVTQQHSMLKDDLTKLQDSHGDVHGQHRTLAQYVEQVAGQGGEFHSKLAELQEATTNELQEHGNQLRAQSRKWQAHQTSFEERLENVEGMLTEFFDKNNRDMEAVQSRMSDLDLESQARQQEKETWRVILDRCELLERVVGFRRRDDAAPEDRKVSYSIQDQLQDHDDRLSGLECRTHEEHSRLWIAMDSHTHDLNSQTLRKVSSPDASPSRVQTVAAMQTVPVVTTPITPMAAGPAVPAAVPAVPVAMAPRPEPRSPARQGSLPGFPKAGSRGLTATSSVASVASVATVAPSMASVASSRTISPSQQLWPEEVERISCGRARYAEPKP